MPLPVQVPRELLGVVVVQRGVRRRQQARVGGREESRGLGRQAANEVLKGREGVAQLEGFAAPTVNAARRPYCTKVAMSLAKAA